MTRPTVSPVAERIYLALGPFIEQDETYGWPLLHYIGSLTRAVADVEVFAGDQGDGTPGWVILLDPDNAPTKALPFLGQMVGVTVPVGTDDTTARALINAKGGWGRGTPAAIIAAARTQLTGAKHITLTERPGGNAYRLTVTTYTAETPDTSALHAVIQGALPAGIVASYVLLTGWLVSEMETEESAFTIADLEAGWATVGAFEAQIP